jgi:phosphatidylglycerol lysyltransferase
MSKARFQQWVVRYVAGLVFSIGLLTIYRPILERLPERFESLLAPVSVEYASRTLDIFFGLTLVYFSYQLLQRKQLAWWIASCVILALALLDIASSRNLLALAILTVSFASLLVTKSYFQARAIVNNIFQGIIIFLISLIGVLLYGALGFWLLGSRAFLLMGDPAIFPRTRQAHWFLNSLAVMGASSIAYGFYGLFKPLTYRLQTLPAEREKMLGLLMRYSKSSDDYFKLWPHDKSYYFANHDKAAVAYGVNSGIALAVGDAVGKRDDISVAIKGYDNLCLTNGWSPAFIYIGGYYLSDYQNIGYDVLKIGEDAVVNLSTFKDQTVNNKHFRNIRNRFAKEGYEFKHYLPPHSPELMKEIDQISTQWASLPDRKEWKFLAGNYSHQYISQSVLFVVRDSDGHAQAFANQIPTFSEQSATIDLMRYNHDVPSGIMDFLFCSIMLELSEKGVLRFNLGLAPLAGLDGEVREPEEKLLGLIYRSNQKFISFKGLRQFKSKFEPVWEPKYVAYKGGRARLPQIALALSRIMRSK